MTDEPVFEVIFRGDIAPGHQMTTVKERLKSLFKVDDARIDQLFSGRPEVIKKDIDAATAERYRDSLLKTGALVQLRGKTAGDVVSTATPAPTTKPAAQVARASGSATAVSAPQPVPELPDSEPDTKQPASEVPAADGEWTLAPVGSDVLRPDERHQVIAAEVRDTDFELAPAGADLLNPGERPKVEVPEIDVSHLSVDMSDAAEEP